MGKDCLEGAGKEKGLRLTEAKLELNTKPNPPIPAVVFAVRWGKVSVRVQVGAGNSVVTNIIHELAIVVHINQTLTVKTISLLHFVSSIKVFLLLKNNRFCCPKTKLSIN